MPLASSKVKKLFVTNNHGLEAVLSKLKAVCVKKGISGGKEFS